MKKLAYSECYKYKVNSLKPVSNEIFQIKDTESVFVDIGQILHLAETEVKEENVTEDENIDPLEPPVKMEESDSCDLEFKIEIEEDMIFKTEPVDLSEFL